MHGAIANNEERKRLSVMLISPILLIGGLILNIGFERHNPLKLWENSPYPISWADLFYPPLCVFLCLTGLVLMIDGLLRANTTWRALAYSAAIAIPITVLYTVFVYAMQFVATGADRLGECPGLDAAAASSNVIPESKWGTNRPAVGCAVERRGVFLSFYNDIDVYGVTDPPAQQQVLAKLAQEHERAQTHPLRVRFFERENVSVRQGKSGAVFRSAAPVKLIRVASIG